VTVAVFDTLQAARALEATGMERLQAEAIAEATREASTGHDEFATRGDLYRSLRIRGAALVAIQLAIAGAIISLLP